MTQNKALTKQAVTNPYPKWQANGGCCWVCYRLLWTATEVKANLCEGHQSTHIAEVTA